MKKQKDSKISKRDAFKSFLETSATPVTFTPTSEISPQPISNSQLQTEEFYQQYVEDMNGCNVCGQELDQTKKKKCGFCNLVACNDHLRKRRRKKGKFERICDNCEDRVLYDIYMKLQAKAQESISVEQQITYLKHQNFSREAEQRRQKRREIGFKTMAIQQKYEQETTLITNHENSLMSFEHSVESLQLSVEQLQAFVQRVQGAFKQNFEQDFKILSQQNIREAKELAKIQKKCLQIRTTIEKREKQIEEAYQVWEQRQFNKKIENQQKAAAKKNDGCEIY